MDDFSSFERDFGLRPQGKAAPMSHTRSASARTDGGDQPIFDDVYSSSKPTSSFSDFDYDLFKASSLDINNNNSSNRPSSPVYDKPVYDENIFDGLPGVKTKSTSSRVSYDENENVFATMLNEKQNQNHGDAFDDLLGNLGKRDKLESKSNKSSKGFDDLLPGFGSMSPQRRNRSDSVSGQSLKTNVNSTKPASSSVMDDPFVVLESTSAQGFSSPEVFSDPLDDINKLSNSENSKANSSSACEVVFDDIDPLDGFGKSVPAFSSEIKKEAAPSTGASNDVKTQSTFRTEPIRTSQSEKMSSDNFNEFHETMFDMPSISTGSRKFVGQKASPPSYVNVDFNETDSHPELSPELDKHPDSSDDVWLTVSEIPLFTQPTSAPPPSRLPPLKPGNPFKPETGFYSSNAREKGDEFFPSPSYSQYSQSSKPSLPTMKSDMTSPIDELENFAMGGTRYNNEHADTHGSEEMYTNSSAAASAAAMKEAMDRAEAKFKHAKEVREREYAKTARNREPAEAEMDEQAISDERERECREKNDRLERELRQRDEEEKEHRRLEREKASAREERGKARQAVERATREARERAAVEARKRAAAETRRKSERATVERVQAEARERAERASVQRAQSEACERAAAEAKEKAEKVAAEARERANAEAREKAAANAKAEAEARRRAERAAVDRAAAEARERAASAAVRLDQQKKDSARMNQQQRNDNDLESFFSMNSRPSSAPRPRANSSDPTVDPLFQSKAGSQEPRWTSSVNTSNMRKTSSTTNLMDDLGSIFGASASSGGFQEVDGETEERRRARLDRHQRTQDRAVQALAEKNQRDLQSQWEQDERHRISATLDIEVKRWAAGKEGNLRALLSTLHYVLWPECGWTPVSLTDLITGASVKKVYRKATLCIHPDKVQQKGANIQQKCIAEKVFDLLKEAWNKFNSEELY